MTTKHAAIEICVSSPLHHDGLRKVHERAFGRKDEADLVDTLLSSDALIDDLSLVAISEGQVVGHILYTRVDIVNDQDVSSSSKGNYAIALAPLAILPEFQKQGIGSLLMNESIAKADKNGHGIIIVLGHPEYYPKFGFQPASQYGMSSPFDAPDNCFMARPLSKYEKAIHGDVVYHEAFNQID